MSPSKDLASAGSFFFAPIQYSQIQAFTAQNAPSKQLYVTHQKTAYKALQILLWLFAVFYCCYVTVHQAIPHYLHHAGAYHSAWTSCTGQHSRHTIIRYIRVQGCAPVMDPCQTVQHIADYASPAESRCFPRPAACDLASASSQSAPGQSGTLHPAGQSSNRRAARNHWLLPPQLFSGFRPIANRGQQ